MKGDGMAIPDEAITRLIKAFYEAHGTESWESSAEYRYGAEHHWMREAFAEIAPLLVSAEAERLKAERDDLIAETRKWRRAYDESQRISAAVVEGLRAELAERDAKLRKAMRVSEWRVSAKDDEVFAIAVATLTKHWDCGDGL